MCFFYDRFGCVFMIDLVVTYGCLRSDSDFGTGLGFLVSVQYYTIIRKNCNSLCFLFFLLLGKKMILAHLYDELKGL